MKYDAKRPRKHPRACATPLDSPHRVDDCTECSTAKARRWLAKPGGRELNKNYRLKYLYGITADDYANMLSKQGGLCALCGTDKSGQGHSVFCVDHNHQTGEVRGLLCRQCNLTIGWADKQWPDSVLRYLGRIA